MPANIDVPFRMKPVVKGHVQSRPAAETPRSRPCVDTDMLKAMFTEVGAPRRCNRRTTRAGRPRAFRRVTAKAAQPMTLPSRELAADGRSASLELSGISKRYPGVQALNRVSLECRPGEIHAVLGENGSGKSTLLGIAGGAVVPDEGRVTIMGERADGGRPAAGASARSRHRLPGRLCWCANSRVADNLVLGVADGAADRRQARVGGSGCLRRMRSASRPTRWSAN